MMVSPAGALLALDLWDADNDLAAAQALGMALPEPGRSAAGALGTVLRVGPRRWWLDGAGFAPGAIVSGLNGTGVVTPVGGGLVRVQLSGARWREVIMASGLIDAEDPGVGPGSVAITALHHARSVLHVRAAALCDVYLPASYAEHCLSAWRDMGWQQVAA